MPTSKSPPWRKAPSRASKKRGGTKLAAAEKHRARERATKAGRRYPNLIDNMFVTAQRRKGRKHGQTS